MYQVLISHYVPVKSNFYYEFFVFRLSCKEKDKIISGTQNAQVSNSVLHTVFYTGKILFLSDHGSILSSIQLKINISFHVIDHEYFLKNPMF